MKHFMIGQFGAFDDNKFTRDYRDGFYGIEACLMEARDIDRLLYMAAVKPFNVGIHFPLRAGITTLRDPQFLSLDPAIREKAFKTIEDELIFIKQKGLKPAYILFHYPKPVILSSAVDWRNWRFADKSEYVYEEDYPIEMLVQHSEVLFKWLSEKAEQYDFIPVLELDGLNRYIHGSRLLEDLLDKYTKVKLCLDLGRLHLQDKLDISFNAMEILRRFIKYAVLIHLWNVRIADNLENSHYPALPTLKPEAGWAPIEDYFGIIREENRNVKVMFEHRSDLITEDELEACYAWIDTLLRNQK